MKTSTILRNITYYTKNAEKSAQFFVDVFGLKINHFSESYSELIDHNNFKIVFIKNISEAHSRTSFNPLLTFNILDFDELKLKLESTYPEVEFDGEVKNNNLGKYACIKTPDGIMCVAFEAKIVDIDEDDFQIEYNEDSKLDPNDTEIRTILEKIKL